MGDVLGTLIKDGGLPQVPFLSDATGFGRHYIYGNAALVDVASVHVP